MTEASQAPLFITPDLSARVETFLRDLLESRHRPAPHELLALIEKQINVQARWDLMPCLGRLAEDNSLTREQREYGRSMLRHEDLATALRGDAPPRREIISSIDTLLQQTQVYRSSEAFKEMIQFMGRFRDYAPYNNMLVRTQNPSCGFYATAKDWHIRFKRFVKEDARPMLILAPMHPVMLVYDLDQTEGPPLPGKLENFARFQGDWKPECLGHLIENTRRHGIRIDFRPLSSTHGGFARSDWGEDEWKRRIVVHDGLDPPSQFGVLCHEVAHVLLGHIGGDKDNWWPTRSGIDRRTAEIEAEAVAYIVTTRQGLTGSSAAYLSGYLDEGPIPATVSLDTIAKVASRIERMATGIMPAPRPKPPRRVRATV